MADIPIFDTVGGQVSPSQLFKRLVELMTLIHEDMWELGKRRHLANDDSTAMQWKQMAKRMEAAAKVVEVLAQSRQKTGIGYDD